VCHNAPVLVVRRVVHISRPSRPPPRALKRALNPVRGPRGDQHRGAIGLDEPALTTTATCLQEKCEAMWVPPRRAPSWCPASATRSPPGAGVIRMRSESPPLSATDHPRIGDNRERSRKARPPISLPPSSPSSTWTQTSSLSLSHDEPDIVRCSTFWVSWPSPRKTHSYVRLVQGRSDLPDKASPSRGRPPPARRPRFKTGCMTLNAARA